jgi:hypothetical protein
VRLPDGSTVRERASRSDTVASLSRRLSLSRTASLQIGTRTLSADDALHAHKDATITVVEAAAGPVGKKPAAPAAAPAAAAAATAAPAKAKQPAEAAAPAPTAAAAAAVAAAAAAAATTVSDSASFAVYFRPRPTPSTLAPNVRVAHTCTAQTTVTELKRALVAHLGADWRDATLFHAGKPLQPDSATLASFGVRSSTALEARMQTGAGTGTAAAAASAATAATTVVVAPPTGGSGGRQAATLAPSSTMIAAGAMIAAAGVAAAAASGVDGGAAVRDAALQDAEKQVIELLTQVAMLTPGEINQLAPEFQQQVLDIRRQLNIQPSGADEDSSAGAASQLLERLRITEVSNSEVIADAMKRGVPSLVVAEAAAALHDAPEMYAPSDVRSPGSGGRGARKPTSAAASSSAAASHAGAMLAATGDGDDDEFLDSPVHDDDGGDDDINYADGTDEDRDDDDDDFAGRLAGSTGGLANNAISDGHDDDDDDDDEDVHSDDGGGANAAAALGGAGDAHCDAASGKIDKFFRLSNDGAAASGDASDASLSGGAAPLASAAAASAGGGGVDGGKAAAAVGKWEDSHTWVIENFAEGVADTLRDKRAQMELPPGEVCGIKFRLLVQPKSLHGRGLFSVYLDSGPEHVARQTHWSAKLAFSLRILNMARPEKSSIERTDTNGQNFDHMAPDWGFQDMVDVNTLLDESNGFLERGALRIQASVTRLKGDVGAGSKRRPPNCSHLVEWRRVRDALGSTDNPNAWMDALVGAEGATTTEALDKLVELLVHVVQEDDFPELWSEQLTTFSPLTRLFAEHAEPPDVLEVAREAAKLRRADAARFVAAHGVAVYGDAGFPGEPFIDSLVGSKHVSADVSLVFLHALPALDKHNNAAVETLRSVFNYTVGELIDERVGKLADFKVYGNNGTKNVAFAKAFPKHRDMYLVAAMAILAIKNPTCCAPALTMVLEACLTLNTRLCELDEADATKDLRDVTAVAIRGQLLDILRVVESRRGEAAIAIDINLAGVLLSGDIDILSFVIDSPAFEMENDWWWNAKNVKWCVENNMPAKARLILARFDSEEAHKAFVELLAEAKGKQRELKEAHAFSVAELMPPAAQRRALESFFKERNIDYVGRLVALMSLASKQFCADTVVASDWLCRTDRSLWAPFAGLASERGQRQALRDFLKANAFDLARTLTELMPESVRALCARTAIMSDGLRRADPDLWTDYLAVASAKQLARAFEANHSDHAFAARVNKRAAEVANGDALMREIAPRVRVHAFAEAGDVELLDSWLERGAPIDAVRQRGTSDTPLLAAVARSQYAVVRDLIQRGANVRAVRKPSGENVFHIAADVGDPVLTRQLLYMLRGDKLVLRQLLQQSTAYGRAPSHCTKDSTVRRLLTDAARGVLPSDIANEAKLPPPPLTLEQAAAAATAAAAAAAASSSSAKSSSSDASSSVASSRGKKKGGAAANKGGKQSQQQQQRASAAAAAATATQKQQSPTTSASASNADAAPTAAHTGSGEDDDAAAELAAEPVVAAVTASGAAVASPRDQPGAASGTDAAAAARPLSLEEQHRQSIVDALRAVTPDALRAVADDAGSIVAARSRGDGDRQGAPSRRAADSDQARRVARRRRRHWQGQQQEEEAGVDRCGDVAARGRRARARQRREQRCRRRRPRRRTDECDARRRAQLCRLGRRARHWRRAAAARFGAVARARRRRRAARSASRRPCDARAAAARDRAARARRVAARDAARACGQRAHNGARRGVVQGGALGGRVGAAQRGAARLRVPRWPTRVARVHDWRVARAARGRRVCREDRAARGRAARRRRRRRRLARRAPPSPAGAAQRAPLAGAAVERGQYCRERVGPFAARAAGGGEPRGGVERCVSPRAARALAAGGGRSARALL